MSDFSKTRIYALCMLGLTCVSVAVHTAYFKTTFTGYAPAWPILTLVAALSVAALMDLVFHAIIDDFGRAVTDRTEWVDGKFAKSFFFCFVFGIVFIFYVYTGFMGAKVAVSAAHGAPPPPPMFSDASGAALGDMAARINAIEGRRTSELQGVSKSWAKAKKRDGGGNSWHEQQERAALAGVNAKFDKQVSAERVQSTEAVAVLSNNNRETGKEAREAWREYVTITEGSKQKESGLYSWATVPLRS
jgi:hypothetical protein